MNLLQFLASRAPTNTDRDNFFTNGTFPLDDEVVADTAINAMLLVMTNHQRGYPGQKGHIADYAPLVGYGIRYPWKDRIAFSTTVDLVSDEMPEMAVIGLTDLKPGQFAKCVYITEKRMQIGPRHSALSHAVKIYRVGSVTGYNRLSRAAAHKSNGDIESVVDSGYAGVMADGTCVGVRQDGSVCMFAAKILAYVVSMHSDRKHFWDVSATEEFWDELPAKAHFSVGEEYVKSLFYARSLPMTESGRMRPILHWVRAHQRRIKEGIEIDIARHLRGIDAFVMHDVKFAITSPKKPIAALRNQKRANGT